jgi:hydroxyethylthiazole kinase-like sugar kinase family protein
MDGEKIAALAARVRAARPTVQCIPSNVSGDLMDSVLRAAGAVPVFATSLNEVSGVVRVCA